MTAGTPTEEPVDLMFLLSVARHVLATEHTAALAQLGISPRAFCVLSRAMRGDLTQRELAEQCALDKTTVVVTIDELEKAGLAERRISSADRRVRLISVTEAGRQVVAQAQEIVSRIDGDVLEALPEDERAAFINGLTRLVGERLSTPVSCDPPVRRRMPRAR